MMTYARLVDGIPVQVGRGYAIPDGCFETPDIAIEAVYGLMLVNGEWISRPTLPVPVTDGDTTTMTGAPTGTTCEVCDLEVGGILATVPEVAGLIVIELPDPGSYLLDYRPPLPCMPLSLTVVTP